MYYFPPSHAADENGLLAIGGDLSPERLLVAYSQGIFPWYSPDTPILWWNPPSRMVLFPSEFKISKSFHKIIKNTSYEIKVNSNFKSVISKCAQIPRKNQNGTWILPDVIDAYCILHDKGYAHSVETWVDSELVGGLYGIGLGSVFFGESMFSDKPNASKLAFYALSQMGFQLIDCQMHTDHLESLGAKLISREEFLRHISNLALESPSY